MKRYRFVIYALKDIAGLKAVESLECSTLETKGESLVMWIQKYEPGTEPSGWLTVTVFTRKGGPWLKELNPYMVRVILPFAELFHVEQFENHKRRGFNLAA